MVQSITKDDGGWGHGGGGASAEGESANLQIIYKEECLSVCPCRWAVASVFPSVFEALILRTETNENSSNTSPFQQTSVRLRLSLYNNLYFLAL